jgi:hypothetical protein
MSAAELYEHTPQHVRDVLAKAGRPGVGAVVVDCRETSHGASTGGTAYAQSTWSSKASCQTVKLFDAIAFDGFVVYMSRLVGGRNPEPFDMEGMEAVLPASQYFVFADRGFRKAKLNSRVTVVMPSFLHKRRAFGDAEAALNEAISHLRVRIEQHFGTLAMEFLALRSRYHLPLIELQFAWYIAAAVNNYHIVRGVPRPLSAGDLSNWFQLIISLCSPPPLAWPDIETDAVAAAAAGARLDAAHDVWPGASVLFVAAHALETAQLQVEAGKATFGAEVAKHQPFPLTADLARALLATYHPADRRATRLSLAGFVMSLSFACSPEVLSLTALVHPSMKSEEPYRVALQFVSCGDTWQAVTVYCDCPQGAYLFCSHCKAAVLVFDSVLGGRSHVFTRHPLDVTQLLVGLPTVSVYAATHAASGAERCIDLPVAVHPDVANLAAFVAAAKARQADHKWLCPNGDCKYSGDKPGTVANHVIRDHRVWLAERHQINVPAGTKGAEVDKGTKARIVALLRMRDAGTAAGGASAAAAPGAVPTAAALPAAQPAVAPPATAAACGGVPETTASSTDDDGPPEKKVHYVCCDNCDKWFVIPLGRLNKGLPDMWYCADKDWGRRARNCRK